MNDEPLEEMYLKWLISKVYSNNVPSPSNSYWQLFNVLHRTEFVWILPGDDNRAQDGKDLRLEFFRAKVIKREPSWMMLECSVLEMMVAMARRCEFLSDFSVPEWFWIFLNNMHLANLNDAARAVERKTLDVLDRFIWRTYNYNGGGGGMFPLDNPRRDQRKVEIWYQFSDYCIDQEL